MPSDDDQPDRRYYARELDTGWAFRSPLDRWETITRLALDLIWVRVWTAEVGPDWSYRFRDDERLHAVPPLAAQFDRQPEVRILDLPGMPRLLAAAPRMLAVLTFADVEIPDMARGLADARRLGRGPEWTVSDRPGGGDEVTTRHASKAAAKTALRRVARAHAAALGIRVCEHDGWHHTHD